MGAKREKYKSKKVEKYKTAIRELIQTICLDKELGNTEVVVLLSFLRECGDTGISMIAGVASDVVAEIIKQGKDTNA